MLRRTWNQHEKKLTRSKLWRKNIVRRSFLSPNNAHGLPSYLQIQNSNRRQFPITECNENPHVGDEKIFLRKCRWIVSKPIPTAHRRTATSAQWRTPVGEGPWNPVVACLVGDDISDGAESRRLDGRGRIQRQFDEATTDSALNDGLNLFVGAVRQVAQGPTGVGQDFLVGAVNERRQSGKGRLDEFKVGLWFATG